MLHWPVDYPADAARILLKCFREGRLKEPAAIEAAWNLIGYGLKSMTTTEQKAIMMVGPSVFDLTVDTGGVPIVDEKIFEAIEKFENTPHEKRPIGQIPVPEPLLVKWAMQLCLKIVSGMI